MADMIPHASTPMVAARVSATLLSVVGPLDDSAALNGEVRWLHGLRWEHRPVRALSAGAVDTCNPADFVNPEYACNQPGTAQEAFLIYDAFNASTLDHTVEMIDDLINERVALQLSASIASELLTAAASTGIGMAAVAHAPAMRAFGTASVTVSQGIAILEDDLARTLYNGLGIIHMSPGMLGVASFADAVEQADDGNWYTPLGHRVVADAGYVDMKEPAGQAASAAMKEWMYASGPINLGLTDPELIGNAPNEFMLMNRNRFVRWMSAYGLLQFDSAPVTAVLVDY